MSTQNIPAFPKKLSPASENFIRAVSSLLSDMRCLKKKDAAQLQKAFEFIEHSVVNIGENTVHGYDWSLSDTDLLNGLSTALGIIQMNGKYVLDEKGNPVEETDHMKWAQWMETANRKVCIDIVGDSKISTVFLGLDHSFNGGSPVLWETMVFGGQLDREEDRCSGSREQAEAMHARMVQRVKDAPAL